MDIFATISIGGVPVNGLADPPEIRIRDDANTVVQAFTAMTDLAADGKYLFAFVIPATARSYTFLVDADPLVSGQVPTADRFYKGGFGGEADIVATSVDITTSQGIITAAISASEATIVAAIGALNNLSIADVQSAMTAQGYTGARAVLLDNLVNLDASVLGGFNAVLAAIGALNDIAIADVQTAMDNQNFTAARGLLLDNLDVAVSTRAAPGDAMDLTGATLLAIQALILTDATPFAGANVAATLAAVTALRQFIEGGRDIDFTGNDALGWQRIERDVGGTLLRRYNLFDENGARIDESVASFIGRTGMISSEVAI